MTWRVRRDQVDLTPAKQAAAGRQGYAERVGLPEYGTNNSPEEQLWKHEIGTIGEYITSIYYRLPFNPAIGKTNQVDLKIVEVRTAWRPSGTNLPIRPHDKLHLPYVLGILDHVYFEIVGWLCGWEAGERILQDEKLRSRFIKGAWYVPPPYHSVLSLEQWILCGHRPHYVPPQWKGVNQIDEMIGLDHTSSRQRSDCAVSPLWPRDVSRLPRGHSF